MPTRLEILDYQNQIRKSISDSFHKGIYVNNPVNKKLGRVGQHYGGEGEEKEEEKKRRGQMSPAELVKSSFDPKGRFYQRDTMSILSRGDRYNAEFVPERKAVHEKIIKDIVGKATKANPKEQKIGVIMGGATANGKSSVVKSGFLQIPENRVNVDSDDIKGRLPEYQHMLANNDHNDSAAAYVHEESSFLAKKVLYKGVEMGANVLLDGTGDTSVDSVMKKIKRLKEQGYRVVAHYCTLDTELSFKLAEARYKKTGRFVPKYIIEKTNRGVAHVLPKLIEMNAFDEVTLWDTNEKDNPRKILEMKDGEKTMHSQELYDRFLKKKEG